MNYIYLHFRREILILDLLILASAWLYQFLFENILTTKLSLKRSKKITYPKKIRWWNKPFLPIIFIFKTIPRALSMRPRISAALKRKYRLEIFIYNKKIARAKKLKKRKARFARHIALNRVKSTLKKPTTMLFLGLLVFFAGYLVTVSE